MAAKPVIREPLPGGVLPEAMDIFNDTVAEFMDDPMPYLLAGLGQFAVFVPLFLGMFLLVYFGIFATLFGGLLGGAILGAVTSEFVGPELGSLVFFFTYLGSWAVMIGLVVFGVLAVSAVVAPMQASLTRRVAEHQRGGRKLDFMASFTDMRQDLLRVILVAFTVATVIGMGAMACYIPGLVAMALLTFATTLVALHRRGVMDSAVISTTHVADNFSFHGLFALIYIGLALVAGYIPIIGPMFVMAMHVRAYRVIFGDAEEPVLRITAA